MAETQKSKSERKRERQPISIPFVWEDKPGIPKKDWNPTHQPVKPAPPPPKFIVSVPLKWEEKPGTPLPSFAQHPKQNVFFSSPPTTYSDHDYEEDESSNSEKREIQTWNYESDDDSFTSAKSLLANALKPTNALASAVPVEVESPGSPASEAESCTSYASGTTSLVGVSFLERLFPLLVQNSGSQEKEECVEKDPSCNGMENMEFLHERNYSQVRRKPLLTLGELIVMSRRRSCQRKVARMHKQPSMDLIKGNALGCCIAGIGNGISGFHEKWKKQLQLKLM